nr:MAG TPA: hypothetical protein [Caudoviricetes sp.]
MFFVSFLTTPLHFFRLIYGLRYFSLNLLESQCFIHP